MLTYAFVQSAIDMYDVDYGYTVLLGIGGTFVLGIGALAFGVLLMFLWFVFPRSKPFFRGESLNRETEVLVPDDTGCRRSLGRRRPGLTDVRRARRASSRRAPGLTQASASSRGPAPQPVRGGDAGVGDRAGGRVEPVRERGIRPQGLPPSATRDLADVG